MKIKIFAVLVLLILFGFIFYLSHRAENSGTEYLAVLPYSPGSKTISVKAADDLNEKFPLTYKAVYPKTARALAVNSGVNIVSTNYSYVFVMRCRILNGGFFTKDAQKNAYREAVLNEKAAFDFFGTAEAAGNEIYIEDTAYTVTGVIDDYDNNELNIYIPVSVLADGEGLAESLVVNLSGMYEENVRNELKAIGIDDLSYKMLSLQKVMQVTSEKAPLAAGFAMFGFLLLILKKVWRAIVLCREEIREQNKANYLGEMLTDKGKAVYKFAAFLLLSAVLLVLCYFTITFGAERFMLVNETSGIFNGVVTTGFANEIDNAQNLYNAANLVFILFAVGFSAFIAAQFLTSNRRGPQ
ncbi:MAG: ABC transporter permease [Clostridiales bacterium]|nr:ABC transporter permease [Clostridiales bacterium]